MLFDFCPTRSLYQLPKSQAMMTYYDTNILKVLLMKYLRETDSYEYILYFFFIGKTKNICVYGCISRKISLVNPKFHIFTKTTNFHVKSSNFHEFSWQKLRDFILIFTECTKNQEFSLKCLLLSHYILVYDRLWVFVPFNTFQVISWWCLIITEGMITTLYWASHWNISSIKTKVLVKAMTDEVFKLKTFKRTCTHKLLGGRGAAW